MLIPTEIDQAKQHRALMIQQKLLQAQYDGQWSYDRALNLQRLAISSYCRRINGE